MHRCTARLQHSRAVCVLSDTARASVLSQRAMAEQDAGTSKRVPLGKESVIVGDVATIFLLLTHQPALLQGGHIVDDAQYVILKHTVLRVNRTLCEDFSLVALCPGKGEQEQECRKQ